MGNAALENGACRELLVDVDGVVVAGHGGQDNVGFVMVLATWRAPGPRIKIRNLRGQLVGRLDQMA